MGKAAPSADPMVLATIFNSVVGSFADIWIDKLPDDQAIETLTSFRYAGING